MRPELHFQSKVIIIKLGTNAVTEDHGGVSRNKLIKIVKDISALIDRGFKVILVSSGAIHTARGSFNLKDRDIPTLQALSALGQPELMKEYIDLFSAHGLKCAQVLLTHEDFKNRTRYFNAQSTVAKLLELGVVPILNENDTVSFSEITVGDNDHLAAMVAQMIKADLLVILTSVPGLYDKDPDEAGAQIIANVEFDEDLSHIKALTKTTFGRGGMLSKLEAIKKATPQGVSVILGSYKEKNPLLTVIDSQKGTFFHSAKKLNSRKGWLVSVVKTNCAIIVDEGAYKAVLKHASLLPSGIIEIEGSFKRGDCVAIKFKNKSFALGLVEYDSSAVEKIKGKKAREIMQILGYVTADEVIHRNNLSLKG